MVRTTEFIPQYVLDQIEIGDCWTWTGDTVGVGYGRVSLGGVGRRVHRAIWELLVGPIPEHLVPDHLCLNRLCVNPDHIEMVTPAENIRRGRTGLSKRRYICIKGKNYRICNHDHIGHFRQKKSGMWHCGECHRIREHKRHHYGNETKT